MSALGAQHQSGWRTFLKAFRIPAAVAFLGGIFFTVPAFQEALCSQDFATAHESQARKVCFYKTSWRPTDAEALPVVDVFLATAGGARPSNAWRLLSGELQSGMDRQEFVKDWTPVVWAERVVLPQSSKVGFRQTDSDSWSFTYRTFGGDARQPPDEGQVKVLTAEVTIVFDANGRARIDDLNNVGRAAPDQRLGYPRDFTTEVTVTRTQPSLQAPEAQNLTENPDTVRLLCRTTVRSQLWLRTTDGWLPSDVLRYAPEQAPQIPDCGPDHAVNVTAGEHLSSA